MNQASAAPVRPAAVAGLFYPDDPDALARTVDALVGAATVPLGPPKALIAPHAGYVYSGPIAGAAYALLAPLRRTIRRVVLLGPNHRVPLRGVAASSAAAFATPLGPVPVGRDARAPPHARPVVAVDDAAHVDEHGLEVHLPFLQRCLDDFAVVPLIVGETPTADVARLLEALWGGDETLIVVSSDLSHYLPYDAARRSDAAACRAIETLDVDDLGTDQACGRHPIRGLLGQAAALDLRATALDLRNSGDTAGDRSRVVGYGAWVFEDAASARLNDDDRARLKEAACAAVRGAIRSGAAPELDVESLPRPLRAHRATFATVTVDGALRGCIGSPAPVNPLAVDVARNAARAASADPRFARMTEAEADRAEASISILSTPRAIDCGSEDALVAALAPGLDGLILRADHRAGLFLPQVWKQLPDAGDFVRHLKAKAGINEREWPAGLRAERFSTESF
jgi:AmmeMemoRadiSam system protein B/AmmeMemoRadiSam system protein A